MSESKRGPFTTGFVLGAAAGAALAILLAPNRGEETRQHLRNQAAELGRRAGAAAQKGLTRATQEANQAKARLTLEAQKARGRRRPGEASAESQPSQTGETAAEPTEPT